MMESTFQRQVAGMLRRYDLEIRVPKDRRAWIREWYELLTKSHNQQQVFRATELLALHIQKQQGAA